MAFLDLHDWSLTVLFAALLAANLALPRLPAERPAATDAVCERPLSLLVPLH